jgi:hypothetical protein
LWREPPKLARWLGTALPSAAREKLVGTVGHMSFQVAPRPPMNQALRWQLQQEFLPGVESLSQLLERDLTHWCRDGKVSADSASAVEGAAQGWYSVAL